MCMDASDKRKSFSFGQKPEDKKDKKDNKEKSLLPKALQKIDEATVSTSQAAENQESSRKEEKKTRRLSGTHHLHHREKPEGQHEEDKHDKKYYKKKYEEEHKFKSELAEVVKKLTSTNEALRNEIDSLKLQANTIKPQTPTQQPEPVSFAKLDDKPNDKLIDNLPTTQNLADNPTLTTPKSISETTASYWDSLSNGLGVLYSYVPSFSGITSKLPSMPKVFEPVANHHDPVKPKL